MTITDELSAEFEPSKVHEVSSTLLQKLESPSDEKEENTKVINARLDDLLFTKVGDQVRILKALQGKSYSKEQWLLDAIKRKLAKGLDIKKLPTTRFRVISFKGSAEFLEQIDKQVHLLRKLRGTYSRNQWLLDAINEKVDLEEESIAKAVKKISKTE